MIGQLGWIPYEERTDFGKRLTDNFHDAQPLFGAVNTGVDVPEMALFYILEKRFNNGNLFLRYRQYEGSCVGVSWARACNNAQCGDRAYRNTGEQIRALFPFATWGISRRLGGMNRRGAGSYGAVMAKAGEQFGMLPEDHPKLPRGSIKDGNWIGWSAKIELDWSVPSQWPVKESELTADAGEHQVGFTARAKSTDESAQGIAQGRGLTVATTQWFRPRIIDGILEGVPNDTAAHQWSIAGFYKHPRRNERMWVVDNQWGAEAHGECPYLWNEFGVKGSFSISETTFARTLGIRNTEAYLHGDTEDFSEPRKIIWDLGFGS